MLIRMKKFMILGALFCAAINMNANALNNNTELVSNLMDSISSVRIAQVGLDKCCSDSSRVAMKRNRHIIDESDILTATVPCDYSQGLDSWKSNWFVGVQGGASI